jgi:DNA-binding NarL/FixJ family response regulator
MFADSAHVAAAIAAGAHGYLLKDAGPEEIVRSLQSVEAGQFVLGSGLDAEPQLLLQRAQTPRPLPELSARELEILELMARGSANADIARYLGLTLKTVRNHVSNIYAKLLVADRAQAVLKARDAGLGAPSQ